MITSPRFLLGRLRVTRQAQHRLAQLGRSPVALFLRHQGGDWGDLSYEAAQANEAALVHNAQLLSVYQLTATCRVWVVTEADRSATTLLLAEES